MQFSYIDVYLYDESHNPIYLRSENFEHFRIDIGVIDVTDMTPNTTKCIVDNDEDFLTFVGSDCFVVGHPLRPPQQEALPVWRRGAFASEPSLAIDAKPMFLVDAATGSGMSGSPIIQRVFGPLAVHEGGDVIIKSDRALSSRLVGVYGGRAHSFDGIAPIGYGWHSTLLSDIINQTSRVFVIDGRGMSLG